VTCACGKPVNGTAICDQCEARLTAALRQVPALADDLDVVLSRQTAAGGSYIGSVQSSRSQPLPYDPAASAAASHLKAVLVGWVRNAVETRSQARPEGPACPACPHGSCSVLRGYEWPADRLTALSRYLLRHMDWLRMYDPASEAVDEITHAVSAVRAVAFRERPETAYAGVCSARTPEDPEPCPGELYARAGAASVVCPRCQAEHDMHERRRVLLAAVEGVLCTPAEVVAAVTSLSRPVTRQQVERWISRGRLLSHGVKDEQPLLRVGEVLDLLAGDTSCRCGAPLPAHGTGRPGEVCSRACARDRDAARKRKAA
jgi:hypothetical protein